MIYLDNAATSWPKPGVVALAMAEALASATSPARSAHGPALDAGRVLFQVRQQAAALFGTVPERVVCTSGATEGLNLALRGLLLPGDHAVTTDLEHNAVLRPLYAARTSGVQVSIATSTRGVVTPDAIAEKLRPTTRVVAVTHASNVLGTVQPLAAIAELCAERGIALVVDAAQTAGHLPIAADALGAAALAMGGHKGLGGPAGTGLLILGEGVRPRPLLYGGTGTDTFNHDMPDTLPERYEAGTPNVPGLAGLAAALAEFSGTGLDDHAHPALARARQLREGLLATGRFRLPDTDSDAWGVPVVSGSVLDAAGEPIDSAEVADALWSLGIAARGGFHCAPLVHAAYSPPTGLIRFSPGPLTTTDEVDAAVSAVVGIAGAR